MSVRSTYYITRADAEQKLLAETLGKLHTMSDEDLCDKIIEPYRNFWIVPSYENVGNDIPKYRD